MPSLDLQIGLEAIRSYKRLAYTPWHALAEFIDNSTQSYRDNKAALDREYAKPGSEKRLLHVHIEYSARAGLLVIRDNAMGMDLAELQRALHVGMPPENTAGRSEFGLGLKTAACWFGDVWTVSTKKLGSEVGYSVTVDVNSLASGATQKLTLSTFDAPKNAHYTAIQIEQLHVELKTRTLSKTKESLSSMYRFDTREGKLQIQWDQTLLDKSEVFVLAKEGTARQNLRFQVGKKVVRGWVGVLGQGSTGRANAGFAVIRRGRLLRGWPDAWRPESIFGEGTGRNDLVNQRLTGEIHLDDFDVTHTKDAIRWGVNEEEGAVEDGIRKRAESMIELARRLRSRRTGKSSRHVAIQTLLDDPELRASMASACAGILEALDAMAPVKILKMASAAALRDGLSKAQLANFALNGGHVSVASGRSVEADEGYIVCSALPSSTWGILLNPSHPAFASADQPGAVLAHLHHALADGLVMWAVSSGRASDQAAILALKDAVLRSLSEG